MYSICVVCGGEESGEISLIIIMYGIHSSISMVIMREYHRHAKVVTQNEAIIGYTCMHAELQG